MYYGDTTASELADLRRKVDSLEDEVNYLKYTKVPDLERENDELRRKVAHLESDVSSLKYR